MGFPSGARNPPCVLKIRNCLPPASAGFQPMPAFCDRPNKLPLGLFNSISLVIGRLPAGPDDFVLT